ncbi:MAG: hypothetical protein WCT49_01520 [Candidatus Paceibacterota bacterium]|jgi:hypothetical protein|nr:hypothetical protein [Candidatus Paceibacterota bacterium]
MNTNDLETVERILKEAVAPEDIFGPEASAKKNFRRLASMTHEDRFEDPLKARAHGLFIAVHERWEEAERKMEHGTYGDKTTAAPDKPDVGPVSFKTGKYEYTLIRRIHSGGTCGIFEGEALSRSGVSSPVILRVPHSTDDNDLMEREKIAFDLMKKKAKAMSADKEGEDSAEMFLNRIPIFLESVKLAEPGVTDKKTVNTFFRAPGASTGWFTLEEIREAYPKGVNTRVMTFIWNRVLEGLVFAHASGITHNAVTPNHILIHAENHYGNIIDWTASSVIGAGEKVPYMDDRYRSYFPEETINNSGTHSPSSDIYMSAWSMVYLLGGDSKEKIIPASVEEPMRKFLNRCLQPTRKGRPFSAEAAYKELQETAKDLFGPKKFVDLAMPKA